MMMNSTSKWQHYFTFLLLLFMGILLHSPRLSAQSDTGKQAGSGQISHDWWQNNSGADIQSLLNNQNFPESPSGSGFLHSFEATPNFADNFGARYRGLLYPPETGTYTFWISSDDFSQLWLSSDKNPGNATRIANVPGQTKPREWDRYPGQQSVPISLEAGQAYYIEALHKEATQTDHLAVAWQGPSGVLEIIDGAYLSPFANQLNNVGLGGTAVQSSTLLGGPNYSPENAIDGNTNGNSNSNSITHTLSEAEAWWEIDLGQLFYLDSMRLWNRTDCCADRLADFYVLVSDEPFASQALAPTLKQSGVQAYFFEGRADTYENVVTRAMGRYVRVQLSGTNYLSLAEVQFWGTAVSSSQCGATFQEGENGRLFGDFEVGMDNAASNGFYAHVPESSPIDFVSGLSEHVAQYCVLIQTGGLYQINSRIHANGGGSNSFYVTVDDMPANGFIWSILPDNGTYAEDYISVQGGADPFTTALSPGEHTLKLYQREDGTRIDWFEFELVNAQPTVTNPGDQNNFLNDTVSLTINANDPEDDPLTYTAENLPNGLTINEQSGQISGTVTAVGTTDVTVTVNDGISGPVTRTFQWTVSDLPNGNPSIQNPGDQTNTVGDIVNLKITATDPDDDTLTFDSDSLPTGLSINPTTGLITGTLSQADEFEVTIDVEDGRGGSDSVSFEWVVQAEPNNPPVVTNPGAQADEVGNVISLSIQATDADDDTLSYSADGLPPGLSINSVSGEIAGTLTTKGTYPVAVMVSDGTDSSTVNFTWVVTQPDDPEEVFTAYLPLMTHSVRVDEPNDICADAFPILTNQAISFLHEDDADWYQFTLSTPGSVQVELTNFTAPGQIIVYGGTCANLDFLLNNGNFLPTKIVTLGNLPAGTYYIRIITESGYNDLTPYTLYVRAP